MNGRVLLTWLLLCASSWGVADDIATTQTVFEDATRMYHERRYEAAADTFASALEHETDRARRAVLHANAGTASARADDLGVALWHLEAARRLDPGLPEVARNLQIIRARLRESDEASAPPPSFFEEFLGLPLRMTPVTSSRLTAALIAAALLGLALWRAGVVGKRGVWMSVLLLLAALTWQTFDSVARTIDLDRAVVVTDIVPVRGERQLDADVLYRLSAGSIVSADPVIDGWRRIETDADLRGWVTAESVRLAGE